jgi:DNA-binding MarR family transcriptional regulator
VTVLVTRLSRLVYRRSTDAVMGLRLKEFVILNHLRDQGGLSQHALVDVLCLDANNVVLLLNQLESAGYATRRRDPADRRRHIVEITDGGRAALEHAEKGMDGVEDEVLAALDAGEREMLRALLARALEAEPGRPGAGPAGGCAPPR